MSTLPQTVSLAAIDAAIARQSKNRMAQFFSDTGPTRRELYPKHLSVFAAGLTHRERGCVSGNRCGKTELACYEMTCHLTGRYPAWWPGRRYQRPINAWACGTTNITTRDIVQAKLLGKMKREGSDKMDEAMGLGTGMVPAECIKTVRPKSGIPDAIETAYIKHVSGGLSVVTFKSFEAGREAYEGTEQDFILLDEEPPLPIYTECCIRTMATGQFKGGAVLLTFTPQKGWTDVIARFFDEDECQKANRFLVQIEWDDCPHLSAQEKADLLSTIPEYQRDARTKGIPQLGAGAIYPIPESELIVEPFEIPKHWPRVYGLDVGWNVTAAIWLAKDRESECVFAYSELYAKQEEQHAETVKAINARGKWIPGVIDPAARGRGQKDGISLMEVYRDLGLKLDAADHAVEAGIHDVQSLMEAGKFKVFKSLVNWLSEFRIYRRAEDGRGTIIKKKDHLMDATRYATRSGLDRMRSAPQKSESKLRMINVDRYGGGHDVGGQWMG